MPRSKPKASSAAQVSRSTSTNIARATGGAQKAKVFMTGRSQAIRLPKEFRVDVDEVYLKKTPEGILVTTCDPWDELIEFLEHNDLPETFLENIPPRQAPQQRKWWYEA
jgi:antitoxin VapB